MSIYTSVLDNFNRANGALGANWTSPVFQFTGTPTIVSNAMDLAVGGGAQGTAWTATSYSLANGPIEVAATLSSIGGGTAHSAGIGMCFANENTGTERGYTLEWSRLSNKMSIRRYDAGSGTDLAVGGIAMSDGDQISLILSTTGQLAGYANIGGGGWQLICTAQDTTYTSGHLTAMAVQIAGLDDFSGGNFSFPAAASILPNLPTGKRGGLQVIVGDQDMTSKVESLTCSNTDPGGFEIAAMGFPSDERKIPPGSRVKVIDGIDIVWEGRVTEKADQAKVGRGTTTVQAEGYKALLHDTQTQQVFADRDLSHWSLSDSVQRLINLAAAAGTWKIDGTSTAQTDNTGNPAVMQQMTRWSSAGALNGLSMCECMYDSHGIPLDRIYYDMIWFVILLGTWVVEIQLSADDVATAGDQASFATNVNGSGYLTATSTTRTFAFLRFYLNQALTGDGIAGANFRKMTAYGRHNIPRRGSDPGGFYPSDIARFCLGLMNGNPLITPGVIPDSSNYILPHSVYFEQTPLDTIIGDQAKYVGWHWGVWEGLGAFNNTPRLDFRPPPPEPTAVVVRSDCGELDLTARLADQYDSALVTYQDVAGAQKTVTVSIYNPILADAGIHRVLNIDAGISNSGNAQSLGTAALLLSQQSSRAAGSVTLPARVRLPSGGTKPAHFLRAGIDRLRVLDIPDVGSLTEFDTRRRDTFRISRVEVTWDAAGLPQTRVEIDDGSNLLETLQARLDLVPILAGV